MFTCYTKDLGRECLVYAVRPSTLEEETLQGTDTMFLLYFENIGWLWRPANEFYAKDSLC